MRYFYYRIFKALLNKENNNNPALPAMVLLITLQAANIFTVFDVINCNYKLEFDIHQPVIEGLLLFLVLFIPNYFYLLRNHDKIIKQYQSETKEDKIWGIIGLLLYIVVSITVFFAFGGTIVRPQ